MSDDDRDPLGRPVDDDNNDGATEGEVTEQDYEEVEDMDEELTDDPTTQAPEDAGR